MEIAEIATVAGEDGTARTRAAYSLRNRSLQFLMVELPEGAELWGVTLNGKPVAVGTSAGGGTASPRAIRIPVERVGSASMDLDAAMIFRKREEEEPVSAATAVGIVSFWTSRLTEHIVLLMDQPPVAAPGTSIANR